MSLINNIENFINSSIIGKKRLNDVWKQIRPVHKSVIISPVTCVLALRWVLNLHVTYDGVVHVTLTADLLLESFVYVEKPK